MLWRKKPVQETIDIFALVRINDRIQVELDGKTYLSRVEDIRDGELHIAPPTNGASGQGVWMGQILVINIFEGAGIRRFAGAVKGMRTNRVRLLALSDFRCLGTVQRREYVRICQKIPVRFRFEETRNRVFCWFDSHTCDISGGGLQIATDPRGIDSIYKGDRISLEIQLPDQAPIEAKGRVVRSSACDLRNVYVVRFSVQFAQIAAADRTRIVRYVLNQQAAMLASRRDLVPCERRVPVRYGGVDDRDADAQRIAHATDLSAGGMKMTLAANDLLTVGKALRLMVELPGGGAFQADGEVLWLEVGQAGSGEVQAGIRFIEVSPWAQKCIARFLDELKNTDSPDLAKSA